MNRFSATLAIVFFTISGCMTGPGLPAGLENLLLSHDHLERKQVDVPGILELHPNPDILGYDAVLLTPVTVSYMRSSHRLTDPARDVFAELLWQSAIDGAEAAAVPIVQTPGPCVLEMTVFVRSLSIDPGYYAKELAKLTLVLVIKDSESRQPLLRYSRPWEIPNPTEGVTDNVQLQHGIDRVVNGMDLGPTLRDAGLDDVPPQPGCKGTLASLSRAAGERLR